MKSERLQILEDKVWRIYEEKSSGRDDWADWLFANHVFVVADEAEELAERFNGDMELSRVAALLHDIADAQMKREEKGYEEKSLEIARELLTETDYEEEEIKIVVDDALRYHSCRNGETPSTKEGKVLATADALAHFKTNFYEFAKQKMIERGDSQQKINDWMKRKIEKDINQKISFDKIREEALPAYEKLKAML